MSGYFWKIWMKDKITKMETLSNEIAYLRDEYSQIKLWGSCPDGDVTFETIMEWLVENEYTVAHMLKVSKEVNSL